AYRAVNEGTRCQRSGDAAGTGDDDDEWKGAGGLGRMINMQANQVNYASSLNSASSIQPSRSQTDGVLTEVRCQIDGASENIANMAFRVEQLGERLFGAIPASDDEKTPGVPHPVSGHVDAIQH